MNKKYIAGIVAISTVLLALILKELVADKIITPIWKFIMIFDDMPQALLWFFSIGLLMLLEWKSFGRWSIPWFKSRKKKRVQKVFVAGCLSHRYKKDIVKEIPEIDAVFGIEDYQAILKTLGKNDYQSN